MNKVIIHFIVIGLLMGSSLKAQDPYTTIASPAKGKDRRVAIVYLSRTKNTFAVAQLIQEKMGGEMIPLELQHPYPEDYNAIVRQVVEENASGFLPPLKTKIDIDKYDTLFLGFPTWGMRLPPPIKSFLNAYDLTGKTIIPFNTNAGYGVGSGFRQVKALCKGCNILKGLSVKGGVERDGIYLAIKGKRRLEVGKEVDKWLASLKLLRFN